MSDPKDHDFNTINIPWAPPGKVLRHQNSPARNGTSAEAASAPQPAGKPKPQPMKQPAKPQPNKPQPPAEKVPPWVQTVSLKAMKNKRALAEARMTLDRQNLRSWTLFPEQLRIWIERSLETQFSELERVYRIARGLNTISPCSDERLVRILAHIFFFESLAKWAESQIPR